MLATQLRGERGDAYVAFESVMRVHAKGVRWERSSAVNETETLGKDEENGTGMMGRDEKKGEAIREMRNQRNRKRGVMKMRLTGAGKRWGWGDEKGDEKRRDIVRRRDEEAESQRKKEIKMTEDKGDQAEMK